MPINVFFNFLKHFFFNFRIFAKYQLPNIYAGMISL